MRKAAGEELLELWGYESIHTASPNAKFFYGQIKRGNAEFWTIDCGGELVGELYVFFELEDKDFADGEGTAYLCAFRVKGTPGPGFGDEADPPGGGAYQGFGVSEDINWG